jgi:hypothetical protein
MYFDSEFRYFAGQTFSRIHCEIRAPLHVLHRLLGWEAKIVSRKTSGPNSFYWFSYRARTRKEAVELWARLLELYPNSLSNREYTIAAAGGRTPCFS